LDLFISLYGAEAGNLALKMKATGGLFVGGGIAPRLVEKLKGSATFMDAFTAKGRMRSLLEAMPVQLVSRIFRHHPKNNSAIFELLIWQGF
jgi:glucokinase